ncbi:MAG: class I SAM-dependent methyltransferase [Burkholderiales bacterium]|nr:class I SAM-dependent methyltransferase [Burkholderiales bacterium]
MFDEALLEAFENRVRKRDRHLGRWAKREQVTCYRVYDRDIPEVAIALDRYGERTLLQQYLRSSEEPPPTDIMEALRDAAARGLEVDPASVTVKHRRKVNRRESQHEKSDDPGADFVVGEGGSRFIVNLDAYLDTGLFLDHRATRLLVRAEAAGRRMLNLFCYTGSFTVHAAAGGAPASVSVDLSNTYLAWARRNFDLNALDPDKHTLERADVLDWLYQARRRGERFGLIVLDPPAYSSSKKMDHAFDVQRDHGELLEHTTALLERGGVLYFSTNLRGFRLDAGALTGVSVEDISARTIPEDFRNQRIHQCWRIVMGI